MYTRVMIWFYNCDGLSRIECEVEITKIRFEDHVWHQATFKYTYLLTVTCLLASIKFCCFYNVLTFQMLLMVGLIHDQLIVCFWYGSDANVLNHNEVPHNAVYNHLKLCRLKKGKPYLTIFKLICALCVNLSKVKPIITIFYSFVNFLNERTCPKIKELRAVRG